MSLPSGREPSSASMSSTSMYSSSSTDVVQPSSSSSTLTLPPLTMSETIPLPMSSGITKDNTRVTLGPLKTRNVTSTSTWSPGRATFWSTLAFSIMAVRRSAPTWALRVIRSMPARSAALPAIRSTVSKASDTAAPATSELLQNVSTRSYGCLPASSTRSSTVAVPAPTLSRVPSNAARADEPKMSATSDSPGATCADTVRSRPVSLSMTVTDTGISPACRPSLPATPLRRS